MTALIKRNTNWPTFFNSHDLEYLEPISHELDRIFKNVFPDFDDGFITKGSFPKVDAIEYSDKITVESELPGYTKSDIDICIKDNMLTISGKRNVEDKKEEKGIYKIRELKKSSFSRSFRIGDNIDVNNIDAKFEHGILMLTLNKLKPENKESDEIKVKIK